MAYSLYREKAHPEGLSASCPTVDGVIPYLLAIQVDSYKQFLARPTVRSGGPRRVRLCTLRSALYFPIVTYSGSAALEYVGLSAGQGRRLMLRNVESRSVTYAAPLRVKVRLIIYDQRLLQ